MRDDQKSPSACLVTEPKPSTLSFFMAVAMPELRARPPYEVHPWIRITATKTAEVEEVWLSSDFGVKRKAHAGEDDEC